jgi:hypothetical protein
VSRAAKLARWMVFSVLIALMPLVARGMIVFMQSGRWNMDEPLRGGAMFLVCTGIAATSVGELIPGDPSRAVGKIFAAGACMFVVLTAAFCYASLDGNPHVDLARMARTSLRLFIWTVLAGSACVYLGNGEKA